jgi:CRISPR-associated protein Cmr1
MFGATGRRNSSDCFDAESKVFGSQEIMSSVSVITTGISSKIGNANEILSKDDPAGLRYLWYSTNLGGNDRQFFDVGTTFYVVLRSKDKDALQMAVWAFWLLAHCGGVGTRSRRAAGSFLAVVQAASPGLTTPSFEESSLFSLTFKNELAKGLEMFGGVDTTIINLPQFDILHPQHAKIWLAGCRSSDWKSTVNSIGEELQQFRSRREPDYHTIKNFLSNDTTPMSVQRSSFGLPLTFRFRSLKGKTAHIQPEHSTRRASPLHIRIIRIARDHYDAMLTFFDSEFIPSKTLNIRQNRLPNHSITTPDGSIVPMFISERLKNATLLFGESLS